MENYISFFDIISERLDLYERRSRRRYGVKVSKLSNVSGRLLIVGFLVYDCERVSRKRKRVTQEEDNDDKYSEERPFIMILVEEPDNLNKFENANNFWVNTIPITENTILFYGRPTKELRLRIGKMFTIKARNLVTKYPSSDTLVITSNATFQCTFDNSIVQ